MQRIRFSGLVLAAGLIVLPARAQTTGPDDAKTQEVATASAPATGALGKGEATACVNGFAAIYRCENVDLVAHVSVPELGLPSTYRLNDLWGWEHAASGRAFALVGSVGSTVFVEVTDPAAPVVVGELPMTPGSGASAWRDIKVAGNHAYVVQDGSSAAGHGMQVFDLTQLLDVPTGTRATFSPTTLYTEVGSAHNVVVNEDSDLAVIVGAGRGPQTCGGGLHMVDISDPANPVFAGCFTDALSRRGYSHDAQCVIYQGPDAAWVGRDICVGYNEDAVVISDVTDRSNPVAVSSASYPQASYVHQGWFTEDHRYLVQDDELDERAFGGGTATRIWDVTDLDDPVLVSTYRAPTTTVDHNLYTKGDLVYQANYTAGLRILDLSTPENPVLTAYFDTYPQNDDTDFDGAWSVYPYLSSDVLLVSDRDNGLFILRATAGGVTTVQDFQTSAQGSRAMVSWRVPTVAGTASMTVERTTAAGAVQTIVYDAALDAPGDYTFEDRDLEPGAYSYRLLVQSTSSAATVFEDVQSIRVLPEVVAVQGPFPNPTPSSGGTLVVTSREEQPVTVDLYDAAGRNLGRLLDVTATAFSEHSVVLPVADLASGRYFLRITAGDRVETRDWIVAR